MAGLDPRGASGRVRHRNRRTGGMRSGYADRAGPAAPCPLASRARRGNCRLCRDGGEPPEGIFGWSNESPLAANLNFLLSGEGNIPWMVRELVRKANADATRQPRILIG